MTTLLGSGSTGTSEHLGGLSELKCMIASSDGNEIEAGVLFVKFGIWIQNGDWMVGEDKSGYW
jgi:hypothetical protein